MKREQINEAMYMRRQLDICLSIIIKAKLPPIACLNLANTFARVNARFTVFKTFREIRTGENDHH